jgi:hypothetical protein
VGSRFIYSEDNSPQRVYVPVSTRRKKRYGFFGFLFDIVMTFITSGFWLIWVFVREMRR